MLKPIKQTILKVARTSIRQLARFNASRKILNHLYQYTTPQQRSLIQAIFSGIFYHQSMRVQNGVWSVTFANRKIQLPIATDNLAYRWRAALSILVVDGEVKQTYQNLLLSDAIPDLFVDVGTNFGTHSLIFLVHNVPTHSIEPNPACHPYFREICDLNHVTPTINPIAIGERNGTAELVFPENENWFGTINIQIKSSLQEKQDITSLNVEVQTLDIALEDYHSQNMLIKIDTEGHELSVLQGAQETLTQKQPLIIFEAINIEQREAIYHTFTKYNYQLHNLPWHPEQHTPPLTESAFIERKTINFIALPPRWISKIYDE